MLKVMFYWVTCFMLPQREGEGRGQAGRGGKEREGSGEERRRKEGKRGKGREWEKNTTGGAFFSLTPALAILFILK